jgi:hypothetical protein
MSGTPAKVRQILEPIAEGLSQTKSIFAHILKGMPNLRMQVNACCRNGKRDATLCRQLRGSSALQSGSIAPS